MVALADRFGYRGSRGFALWMMDLYYRILNSGTELPLSAGSANGVKATPVGYDRVYVRLRKGQFDYPGFMQALKRGTSSRRTARSWSSKSTVGSGRVTGSRPDRAKSTGSAPGPGRVASWRSSS